MKLNDINKDQIKKENEKKMSRTLSKKFSLNLDCKKSKSVYETNQESFGVKNDNQIQDPITTEVQDDDSDSSDLPDDYDPDAVTQISSLN